ncbi:hypothetical protein ES703_108536 [subsurface metagenome]
MSAGSISGVPCTRLNWPPIAWAKVRARVVLAVPGSPSISTCPWLSNATSSSSFRSSLPMTTLDTSVIIWLTISCFFTCFAVIIISFLKRFGAWLTPYRYQRYGKCYQHHPQCSGQGGEGIEGMRQQILGSVEA